MSKLNTIYGRHAVFALLDQHPHLITQLFITSTLLDELKSRCSATVLADIDIVSLSKQALTQKFGTGAVHQGIAAICEPLPTYTEKDLPRLLEKVSIPLVLILDQVQDPHNLGACLRSANAMGASCVIIPKDRSAGVTPVVQKVACGAIATTPIVSVTNLSRCMQSLQKLGLWLVGLAADSDCELRDVDLSGPVAIVMGGEANGLRHLTKKHCDYLARIPMYGTVESLNVSVATGMTLYEVSRQRHSV